MPNWEEKPGFHFGRTDLERVGLFIEAPCLVGKYVEPVHAAPLDRLKGGTYHFDGTKWKSGLQDCYFDKEPYKRIFQKEGYSDQVKQRLKEDNASNKKIIGGRLLTYFTAKQPSTPGDHYGTFNEANFPAMSPKTRPKPKKIPVKSLVMQGSKQGGPGYADICFDKYPEHKPDPYDGPRQTYLKRYLEHMAKCRGPYYSKCYPSPYFDPNPYKTEKVVPTYKFVYKPMKVFSAKPKFILPSPGKKLGGNKSGCFDKITYKPEKYLSPHQVDKTLDAKLAKYKTHDSGQNVPNIHIRSWRIRSTVEHNIKFRVHAKNWRNAQPITYPCK